MKKVYIRPFTVVLATDMEPLMNGSGVSSNNGIDYGGVDEEGEKDPASNRHRKTWDDWEDDEEDEDE